MSGGVSLRGQVPPREACSGRAGKAVPRGRGAGGEEGAGGACACRGSECHAERDRGRLERGFMESLRKMTRMEHFKATGDASGRSCKPGLCELAEREPTGGSRDTARAGGGHAELPQKNQE